MMNIARRCAAENDMPFSMLATCRDTLTCINDYLREPILETATVVVRISAHT
jgi:hypothetical protein